jgi:hypothetical protein
VSAPAITARPTLRGLRGGKDGILDRALRYLQAGRRRACSPSRGSPCCYFEVTARR